MLCQHCQKEKDDCDFPTRNDRSGRLRPYCKVCSNRIEQARYTHHRKTAPFKHRCTRAKARAKAIGVSFNLDEDYLREIWTGRCPVLNLPINLVTDRKDEMAAELDRFKPELGYVKGNVHFLSRRVNRLKNNVTVDELEQLINWMKKVSKDGS